MKRKIILLILLSVCVGLSIAQIPTNGLVGFWPFSGNADDMSGNGNNGIINDAMLTTDRFGHPNCAFSFDGNTNYIQVDNSSSFPQNAISICYWLNRTDIAPSDYENYIYKEHAFQSYLRPDSKFESGLYMGISGNWSAYNSLDSTLNNSDWVFYSFTYDNTTKTANTYLNGILDNSFIEANPNSIVRISSDPMYIGRSGSGNTYYVNGILDDIRLYNRALTSSEIASIYFAPDPCDTFHVKINGDTAICKGSSVTLNTTGGIIYKWSNGVNTADNTVYPTIKTTYTVTVTDVNSCTNTSRIVVKVNSLPTVSASTGDTICEGASTTITAEGASIFSWSDGLGDGSVKIVNPMVTTTYTVTGTNADNCSDTAQVVVIVNSILPAILTSGQIICYGSVATISAGGALTYSWSNGLGSDPVTTVSPTISTTYTVTGTDGKNCSDTGMAVVIVNPLPTMTVSGVTICMGTTGAISVSGADTYLWEDGLGTGSTVTVNPISSTFYAVTGTDINNCTESVYVLVVVNPLPTVTAGGGGAICKGSSTIITAGGADTYKWSNGIGTDDSEVVSPTVSKTYKVTGTDENNCTNTAMVTVTVNPLPTVTASAGDTICRGTYAIVTAGGADTYQWSNGYGDGDTKTVTPIVSRTYRVTGTDTNNCSDIAMVTVIVNQLPTITTSGDDSICEGTSTVIKANGAETYLWKNGLGNDSIITVKPTSSTTFAVTGTDINNCSNTATLTVTVNPLPTVTASAGDTICRGASAVVTAGGADTYHWSNGYGDGDTKTVAPIISRTYRVTGTDMNHCSGIATVTVIVNQLPTITTSGDDSVCKGTSAVVTASGAITYKWSYGYGAGAVKTLSPTASMIYTVTGTDENKCSNIAYVSVKVNPLPPTPEITLTNDTLFSNISAGIQWYNSSGLIASETDSLYIPNSTSNYYVISTANGCNSNISNIVHVVITGIKVNEINKNISIFPNPAHDKIFISFKTSGKEDFNLEILNEIGENMNTKKINVQDSSIETLDLSAFPVGVYFIRLISINQTLVKKIIKQN